MMDLAEAIAGLVGPYLPVLLARGEVLLEEAETVIGPDLQKRAQAVWERLHPRVRENPSAESAARVAAERPSDARARAALELQIEDILRSDTKLADEMRELVMSLDVDEDAHDDAAGRVTLAEAVAEVRDAAQAAGVDERTLGVLESDLATVLDEGVRTPPNTRIVESRLQSISALTGNLDVGEAGRRLSLSVNNLSRVVRSQSH